MSTQPPNDDRNASKLTCPVPECGYSHESTQGIIGHIGNGHEDSWDATDVSSHDLQEAATFRDPDAVARAASVKAWFEDEDLPVEKFRFYEHQGFGTIYAVTNARLDTTDFAMFRQLAMETDGGWFSGDRAWFSQEHADALPEPSRHDLKHYLGDTS